MDSGSNVRVPVTNHELYSIEVAGYVIAPGETVFIPWNQIPAEFRPTVAPNPDVPINRSHLVAAGVYDDSGTLRELPLLVDSSGRLLAYMDTELAGERLTNSELAGFLATHHEWNITPFNPRAASIGAAKGAAGSAGNVEVLIGLGAPVRVGFVVTEDDTAVGSILLRDVAATGVSVSARSLAAIANTVSVYRLGWEFLTGLTVCGTATGVSFSVGWRPMQ